jgi:tetratricopeptide (TPR) repeat protein
MQTPSLARLVFDGNTDYVEEFQALASVNLEIQAKGPSAPRLLRKAILEIHLGNYVHARETVERALDAQPASPEAHYQRGVAYALLACLKADAIPAGPGNHDLPKESLRFLLTEAARSFAQAMQQNPGDDEAQERLLRIGTILDTAVTEQRMGVLLRDGTRGAPDD